MRTYLLTWNPKLTPAPKLQTWTNWSTGHNLSIEHGDRLFLMKLGVEPRGIVGSAWATSSVWLDRHWRTRQGKASYVDLTPEALAKDDSSVLSLDKLKRVGGFARTPRAGGIRIPDDIAKELEREWRKTAKGLASSGPHLKHDDPVAPEGERLRVTSYRLLRSGRLRKLALSRANGVCSGCGTDFKEVLNGKGTAALHAHHVKPLARSRQGRVTYLSDLAVLCATCHTLIHRCFDCRISVQHFRNLMGEALSG